MGVLTAVAVVLAVACGGNDAADATADPTALPTPIVEENLATPTPFPTATVQEPLDPTVQPAETLLNVDSLLSLSADASPTT